MSYVITVGTKDINLADDIDITEVKSEVVRNVHAGGGWVALPQAPSGQIEVFVSGGQYLSITEH